MYGMVNKFISTTVIDRYGQDKWDEIEKQLPFELLSIVEMQPYDDETTFGIVGKAVEVLAIDSEIFLRQLGQDWVAQTAKGSYKDLYSMTGGDLFKFIENLNNMHQTIGSQLEGLKPPSFLCRRNGERQLLVQYYSERQGLDIFVVGLLEGLCSLFQEDATVRKLSGRCETQPYTEFEIVLT